MAYTAKCDTAAATKWWVTGTGSAINRLSEIMDDNGSGVEEDDNPGNFQPWATFMTEHVEDAVYQIHLKFDVGDGSNATTLVSINEMVYFDADRTCCVTTNATLELGTKVGDWSIDGSFWSFDTSTYPHEFLSGGVLHCYGSRMHNRGNAHLERMETGSVEIINSILSSVHNTYDSVRNHWQFRSSLTALSFKGVMFSNVSYLNLLKTPDTMEDVHVHDTESGVRVGIGTPKGYNVRITNASQEDIRVVGSGGASGIELVDLKSSPGTVTITIVDDYIKESYTVNVQVFDLFGNALQGVVVDCEDQYGTACWTAGTVTTAADGTITEQEILYKQWVGTSETLITYSPHKFTIFRAGYQTLLMENQTVDEPINWRLELQPLRSRAYGRARRMQVTQFV